MANYRRMEWQYWMNRASVVVLVALIILDADEVRWAFKYHFPWWDDFMMMVSYPVTYLCWFVKKHTDMYRFDL